MDSYKDKDSDFERRLTSIDGLGAGRYSFRISGAWFPNEGWKPWDFTGQPVDLAFTGNPAADAAVWRLVPGAHTNAADGTVWVGWWMFRTDIECHWGEPGPLLGTCQCWSAADEGAITYWNTDAAATGPPEDFELFGLYPIPGHEDHYVIQNERASQGRKMVMQYDGRHFYFAPVRFGITVKITQHR